MASLDQPGPRAHGASRARLDPPVRVASRDQPGLPGRWDQQVRQAQQDLQDLPIHSEEGPANSSLSTALEQRRLAKTSAGQVLALLAFLASGFFVVDRLVLLDEVFDFAAARGTLCFLLVCSGQYRGSTPSGFGCRLATSLTLWAAPVISVLAISEPPP